MMRPASSRKQASKKHYPVVGFPSGQREQTVNLPSSTSKVRILPPPPSLPCYPFAKSIDVSLYSAHAGKDEKLRLRFDSSVARKRCRRQRPEGRGATRRVILPPPPSLPCYPFIKSIDISPYSAHAGKDEKLRLRFDSNGTQQNATSVAICASPASFSRSMYYTAHARKVHQAGYRVDRWCAPPAG